jgi:hypothetical protein
MDRCCGSHVMRTYSDPITIAAARQKGASSAIRSSRSNEGLRGT